MQEHAQIPNFWDKNRLLIKGFLTGFLILLMLIPQAFISELVSEREARQTEVINEVSSKWAYGQTLKGPVLYVPYKVYSVKDGKTIETISHMYLLPEQLSINGRILPEVRHRSLYSVTLYRSDLNLSGKFHSLPFEKMQVPKENIMWSDCRLIIGLDDARGLEEEVVMNWSGAQKVFEAGVPENNVISDGLNVPVVLSPDTNNSFSVNIKLKGSGHLYFTPVGKTTDVKISSTWADPAFDGQYLPLTTASISDSGFNAQWKVLQVSRSYPQFWKESSTYDIDKSSFGYVKTQRSVKYAILFIALTFIIFFFLEILQKRQVHPLQYILVGFALSIFYTLLLSISEYTGFNIAYTIAASATVALIGLYTWSIFRLKVALGFTIALGSLYTYIFILIQLQDHALIFGSIGLFVILAVIMFYSRKIDWYGAGKGQPEKQLS